MTVKKARTRNKSVQAKHTEYPALADSRLLFFCFINELISLKISSLKCTSALTSSSSSLFLSPHKPLPVADSPALISFSVIYFILGYCVIYDPQRSANTG